METQSNPLKHFRWRATLIRFLVNAVTIFVVVILTPRVYFVDPTFLHLLLMALALGILNATIKPIVQFFTLPFIFVSYGLVIILINSFMIWLLNLIFPEAMAVDSFLWALFAGALYGIVSSFLESLFGLNEPIIPDDNPEDMALREQVDEESIGVVRTFVDNRETKAQDSAALAEVTADEKEEREDGVIDSDVVDSDLVDNTVPVEAPQDPGGVEPPALPAEDETPEVGTAEEKAESVANQVDEEGDAVSDDATVAVGDREPPAAPAEGESEIQGSGDEAAEEPAAEESADEEVKS